MTNSRTNPTPAMAALLIWLGSRLPGAGARIAQSTSTRLQTWSGLVSRGLITPLGVADRYEWSARTGLYRVSDHALTTDGLRWLTRQHDVAPESIRKAAARQLAVDAAHASALGTDDAYVIRHAAAHAINVVGQCGAAIEQGPRPAAPAVALVDQLHAEALELHRAWTARHPVWFARPVERPEAPAPDMVEGERDHAEEAANRRDAEQEGHAEVAAGCVDEALRLLDGARRLVAEAATHDPGRYGAPQLSAINVASTVLLAAYAPELDPGRVMALRVDLAADTVDTVDQVRHQTCGRVDPDAAPDQLDGCVLVLAHRGVCHVPRYCPALVARGELADMVCGETLVGDTCPAPASHLGCLHCGRSVKVSGGQLVHVDPAPPYWTSGGNAYCGRDHLYKRAELA